ncbi:MAG: hypothetical protein ACYTGF_09035 [Planctomycetota bacterium]|jgi:hypothetical protein
MPELIIFILGIFVTLFTFAAVILIGMSEAQDLREAEILDPNADGRARRAHVADRLRSLPEDNG